MAFPPCHSPTSPTCVNTSGHTTFNKSLATLPTHQLQTFKRCSMGPSFIVKANKLRSSEYTVFEPVRQETTTIVTSLVDQFQKQHGKSYPWATGPHRQLPAGYILAKNEEGVPKWSTYHFVRRLPLSPHAQHPGQDDLPAYSGGLPQPLCLRRCLHTPCHRLSTPI